MKTIFFFNFSQNCIQVFENSVGNGVFIKKKTKRNVVFLEIRF